MHRRTLIFGNIINSMKSMLDYMEQVNMPLADPNNRVSEKLFLLEYSLAIHFSYSSFSFLYQSCSTFIIL